MRDLGIPFLLFATVAQVGASTIQQGIAVLSFAFRSYLGLSLPQSGGLVSATSLGVVIAMLAGGRAIDRYGPRPVLILTACLAPLAALVLTFSHGYLMVLFALTLVGLTLGAVPIGGARAIFFRFTGPRRGTAMGIRQTGVPIGAALAAALLPAFAVAHGPFTPWLFLSLVAAVFGLSFALQVPKLPPQTAAPLSPLGRDLLRLVIPSLLAFCLAAGQYGLLTYTVEAEARTVGLVGAGALLAAAQVGGVVGRVAFGAISDRFGNRAVVIALSAIVGAAGLLLAARLGPSVPYVLRLALYFVTGMGAIGWNALLLTWAGERVAPDHAARALGLIGASVFAGSIAFPPLIGEVARLGGFAVAWESLAGMIALAAAAALLAARKAGTEPALGK